MTPAPRIKKHFCGIPYVTLALIAADMCAIFLAFVFGYQLRTLFTGQLSFTAHVELMGPFVVIFPVLFLLLQLYPGSLLHPAEELKRLFCAISSGFLLLMFFLVFSKTAATYSRIYLLVAWAGALTLVPLFRFQLRSWCHKLVWWKTPVILFGNPEDMPADMSEQHLSPFSGLYLACICAPSQNTASGCQGMAPERKHLACENLLEHIHSQKGEPDFLPVHHCSFDRSYNLPEVFEDLAGKYPDALLLLHMPSIEEKDRHAIIETAGDWFRQLLILPGHSWLPCRPAHIFNMGYSFGLSVRRNLADKNRLRLKRYLDLIFMLLFSIAAIPLGAILAACIYLDNPGPVFYRQRRIGKNGETFKVCKFRTMVVHADRILHDYLANNPDAAREWEAEQKLKNDPRITRMGTFLRKTSLDELPQLINIFKGEMSLVGPRPIVADEIEKYSEAYLLYTRCLPGITGLWQVSGRSDTTYAARIALDTYYINNWSVWLDIYIILRTVPVVLLQRGAY